MLPSSCAGHAPLLPWYGKFRASSHPLLQVVCATPDLETLCDAIDALPRREPISQELNDPSYPATLFAPTNDCTVHLIQVVFLGNLTMQAFSKDSSKIIEKLRLGSLEDLVSLS
eukprot:631642-Pelagomonas_calceolata.AAC.4